MILRTNSSVSVEPYKTPILVSVLKWWALLSLVFGTIGAIYFLVDGEGLGAVISLLVGYGQAVIYWGIAELVVFLARTAHNTDRAAAVLERREAKQLEAERRERESKFRGTRISTGASSGIAEDPWAEDQNVKAE